MRVFGVHIYMESLGGTTPFANTTPPPELEGPSLKEIPPVPAPPRFSASFMPVNREAYFEEVLDGSSSLMGATEDVVIVSIDVSSEHDEVELNLEFVNHRARFEAVSPQLPSAFSHTLPMQAGHHRSCFHYIFSWCLAPQVNDEIQPLPPPLRVVES